jgi:hypothetical protein
MECDCFECRAGAVKHKAGYRLFSLEQMVKRLAPNGAERLICPDCIEHIQGECSEADCKNLYTDGTFYTYTDGKKYLHTGQCQCYAKEHE